MKEKYSKADLNRNSKLYEENWRKLVESVGTSEQQKYVKIERKLNKIDIAIRNHMGVLEAAPANMRQYRNEDTDLRDLFYKRMVQKCN